MADQKTINVYNNKASEYHSRFTIDKPTKALNLFMENMNIGSKILDLGCGPGNWAALMKKAGFDVDATDASNEMVRIAQEEYGVAARLATFDDISGNNIYDGVWANFSLLHATRKDFPTHLNAIYQVLKTGGIFHIGMKLGSDSNRDHLERYYTYYQEEELKDFLAQAKFGIIETTTGSEVGLAGNKDPFALFLCKKR